MENLIIIGTGPMAIDYANVFLAKSIPFQVVGRGEQSANNFNEKTGVKPFVGGIDLFLDTNSIENKKVIIATGTEALLPTLKLLLNAGASKVLVEKPAAISIEELLENKEQLIPFSEKVIVAYNRRYYASVIEAKRLIEEDGGLKSMQFEFTEWAHKIEPLQKAPGVKENWFFANSTHVVDMAFHIAGKPKNWKAYSDKGTINWHEKTNFSGAGITENGVLFSYLSNWESAGRWAVELLTNKRRIYLKPLEKIFIQDKGTINLVEHTFDDSFEKDFKPGLYKQVEAFLSSDNNLCTLKEQFINTESIYTKMITNE